MVRIPKCLYLYRIHTDNTYLKRNQEIRGETWKLYGKHIEALVLHWARGKKLPAVDLNLSYEASSGWEKAPQGDYSVRWPWEDSSIGTFRAYDFLNSLPDKMHAMSELHRCLAPGGWVFSFTPAAPSKGAFMDPTARSYWNQNTLWYWTDKNFSRWIKNETVRFQSQRMVEAYPSLWHQQQDIRYVTFDGVAFKPGYDGPGEHKI
jgi:SAM-dependent methyltransferase